MRRLTTATIAATFTIAAASFALRAQEPQQGRGTPLVQPAAAPATPAPPAKPLVPVAASTLASHPDQYFGERVTMTGAVEQKLNALVFSVDQEQVVRGATSRDGGIGGAGGRRTLSRVGRQRHGRRGKGLTTRCGNRTGGP